MSLPNYDWLRMASRDGMTHTWHPIVLVVAFVVALTALLAS